MDSLAVVAATSVGVRKGQIDSGAHVHPSASIWELVHIRPKARVGAESIIGRGVYVGPGVTIGEKCKIQNYAQVYEPALIEDGVFIGPGVILTNDRHPRAITVDNRIKSSQDWIPVGVHVEFGASIGAGAICVAPVRVGRWAMVAAGAVVTRDVKPFQLVAGAPAAHVGWVGPAGVRLSEVDERQYQCPQTKQRFFVNPTGDLEPVN